MKKMFKKIPVMASLMMCLSVFFLSFTSPAGGEGFEIYLNNKLVLQQFGKDLNTVKTVSIDQSLSNVELAVKYYHCGQTGKNRMLTIKDGENKLLKQWKFGDNAKDNPSMCCGVKEILSLNTGTAKKLNLYYSSTELPNGRLLATISVSTSKNTAKL
jgi:hypothetical protein